MVDVGDDDVPPGTVATLYGGRVSLDEQAAAGGTISYELLTALGARVPRRYRGGTVNQHFTSLVLGLAQQAEGALAGKLPPGAEGSAPPTRAR